MWPLLPPIIATQLSRSARAVRGAVGGLTWKPALSVARPALLSVLSRIEVGTLVLLDNATGERYVFGQGLRPKASDHPEGYSSPRDTYKSPTVQITIQSDAFWMRTFLFADMGFAEAYMLGEVECADLTAFFQVSFRPPKTPNADHIQRL